MIFHAAFLKSKVGKRIALLFVLCALVPILSLTVLSYQQVTRQLVQQGRERIHQTCKAQAMAILERLLIIESELRTVGVLLAGSTGRPPDFERTFKSVGADAKFRAIHHLTEEGKPRTLWGSPDHVPAPSFENLFSRTEKRSALFIQGMEGSPSRIFMAMKPGEKNSLPGLLIAELEPYFLWNMGFEDILPPNSELLVFDHDFNLIYSSLHALPADLESLRRAHQARANGFIEWNPTGEYHLAAYRDLFLNSRFESSDWTAALSESKTAFRRPLSAFTRTFPPVILLSLWLVILLSFSQIRRSMVPLEKLKRGAARISRRDFHSRVDVRSGDEFEDLARSFNSMSSELGKQFRFLELIAEIDQGVLSATGPEKIAGILLRRIPGILPFQTAAITFINTPSSDQAHTYALTGAPPGKTNVRQTRIPPAESERLTKAEGYLHIAAASDPPDYLGLAHQDGRLNYFVFPILDNEELEAVVSLGCTGAPNPDGSDMVQARRLFDRVGVALSNMRLVRELKEFNQGTLVALARAIDAKSHWTAGHSERVTRIALQIGRVMNLSAKDLDTIQKGGLLHDIGKLGIPNTILDKNSDLTEEETRIIRRHAQLGAGILEPIAAYSNVMRIVLEHHEHFDGTGYPNGLAGEEISPFSRIYSVADNFDALTSHRPYRRAMSREAAIETIRSGAGTKFDPAVVEAFLTVLTEGSRPPADPERGKISREARP